MQFIFHLSQTIKKIQPMEFIFGKCYLNFYTWNIQNLSFFTSNLLMSHIPNHWNNQNKKENANDYTSDGSSRNP